MDEPAVSKPPMATAAAKTNSKSTTTVDTTDRPTPEPRDGGDAGMEGEECDAEAWEMLSSCFRQVQSVLDRNRALISQVNENHQSKVPDNLTENVELIREINGNISRVLSIYSDLSVNFSGVVHQRRASQNGVGRRNSGKLESSGI